MKNKNYTPLPRFLAQTDYLWHLEKEIREVIAYEAKRDGSTADFNNPFYREWLDEEIKNTIVRAFGQYGINL